MARFPTGNTVKIVYSEFRTSRIVTVSYYHPGTRKMPIQLVVLTLAVGVQAAVATALTFKVPAASKQCFHEDIEVNKKASVHFGGCSNTARPAW
ncbi:hypothetical protein HPB48_013916 [Haemaphysalis longicornis]|uniref:Uncharacterized protein n=1 Tax=Haemaphysalis longicornis TaxID=44386 RepID=A0A9J6G4Q8_HAELO|nr:hypothetical protein HPB48_013916 [Haemaphysalis longicornis]